MLWSHCSAAHRRGELFLQYNLQFTWVWSRRRSGLQTGRGWLQIIWTPLRWKNGSHLRYPVSSCSSRSVRNSQSLQYRAAAVCPNARDDTKNCSEIDVFLVLCKHRCGQDRWPKLKGVQAPVCTSAWAYRKMETFATSPAAPWTGFLLARSVYLWDPPIVGASQPGLPRVLLFAAALTSTSQLQPGLPNQLLFLSLMSRRQAQAGPSPPAAVFQQGRSGWGMSQWLLRASPLPKLWMHLVPQLTGPSVWQLSWALNLLFKVTSVLYPEGTEEQMQSVKSGFNSPASFNFLPCLLINESALVALGIQKFFHIQENSMWWLFQLSVPGLQQAVSCLLWGCFIMVFPAPEALAHRWQLHCISFKGPLAPGSCAPLADRGWLCGVLSWKLLLSFQVFLVFSHVASSAGPCCFLGLCPHSRSAILPQTGCWFQTSLSTSQDF